MKTINDYLDGAINRMGLSSSRQLAKLMGLNQSALSGWRTGRAWPTDDKMALLADLAGEDQAQALLNLNFWRAEGVAKTLYAKMLEKVAVLLVAVSVGIWGIPEARAEQMAHITPVKYQNYTLSTSRMLYKGAIQGRIFTVPGLRLRRL